jgi:hypothetical protein
MSEITDKVRSRAYWEVAIMPEPFDADRYEYGTLDGALQRATVRLRGWPVPYVDHRVASLRGANWIGQDIDATTVDHYEAWRFLTSGQFIQLRSVSADWRTGDAAPAIPTMFDYERAIEVWEILYYLTEVFELAARLALGGPPQKETRITTHLYGMQERGLVVGQRNRSPFMTEYRMTIPDFQQTVTLSRDAIVGDAMQGAINMSRQYFMRFGWNPADEQLAEMQAELTGVGWR